MNEIDVFHIYTVFGYIGSTNIIAPHLPSFFIPGDSSSFLLLTIYTSLQDGLTWRLCLYYSHSTKVKPILSDHQESEDRICVLSPSGQSMLEKSQMQHGFCLLESTVAGNP